MKHYKFIYGCLFSCTILLCALPVFSNNKAFTYMIEFDRYNNGYINFRTEVNMILKNVYGETSKRTFRSAAIEVKGDGDRILIVFDNPRDVKGTALLAWSHIQGDDDQWLYLPALRRVKRLSTSNRNGPFMGSEFSYEDISAFQVKNFTYKYVKNDKIDGVECIVIEQYPVNKNSGYSKRIAWYDIKRYIPMKIEYYDQKKWKLKTLTCHDYKQYLGKYWRAHKMIMQNHISKKSTTLENLFYRFRTNLDLNDFTSDALKRIR